MSTGCIMGKAEEEYFIHFRDQHNSPEWRRIGAYPLCQSLSCHLTDGFSACAAIEMEDA